MSLINIESSSGALVCTDVDGVAISAPLEPVSPERTYNTIKNISADFEYVNISLESSSIDTLDTTSSISIGDTLIIVKADYNTYELAITNAIEITEGAWYNSVDTTTITQGKFL